MIERCFTPPEGWACTREGGHDGPCAAVEVPTRLSYHDVVVFVNDKPMRVFDASYGMLLTCTRAGGWELWENWRGVKNLLAGEYHETNVLRIEIAGIPILGTNKPILGAEPEELDWADNKVRRMMIGECMNVVVSFKNNDKMRMAAAKLAQKLQKELTD